MFLKYLQNINICIKGEMAEKDAGKAVIIIATGGASLMILLGVAAILYAMS